jgi:5S rRNA maturation endonuclease (ribonuclease M5)
VSGLGLVPHPVREVCNHVILVEGPPDMIAARSSGLPATAVPGTSAWQASWASTLAGKRVTIAMNCDAPGRRAADEIAASLDSTAEAVEVVDRWPSRADGYDLTDRILELRHVKREKPDVLSIVRFLLAPHPTFRSSASSAMPGPHHCETGWRS